MTKTKAKVKKVKTLEDAIKQFSLKDMKKETERRMTIVRNAAIERARCRIKTGVEDLQHVHCSREYIATFLHQLAESQS